MRRRSSRPRPDGIPALKSDYGVVFGRFTATDAGGTATVNALKNGTIDAADVFSTDPAIVKNHFVSLADPKSMFAAQNIVPMFAKKTLTQPMKDACDAVSAKLDTQDAAHPAARQARAEHRPDTVAKAWLKQQDLGSTSARGFASARNFAIPGRRAPGRTIAGARAPRPRLRSDHRTDLDDRGPTLPIWATR